MAIATFDIVLPTLESSVGVEKMHWKQAHFERWCVSPLNNLKPTVEMLTEDVIHIKNIHDEPWNPVKTKRTKESYHRCFITFDRSYVVWYYADKLKELVDIDDQLLYDISQECGFDIVNDTDKFPSLLMPDAEIEVLKARAKELGYRIHKLEPKKPKKEVVLPSL